MSQIDRHSPPPPLEDQLRRFANRYRAQQLLRGSMLFVVCATITLTGAALAADGTGQNPWTRALLLLWALWLLFSGWRWIARPVLTPPRPMELARLAESRVDGLHNGLTNWLLLSRRPELAASPWLEPIVQEIARASASRPLAGAIRVRELRPLALLLLLLLGLPLALTAIMPGQILHGWRQLFHPGTFVPRLGSARLLSVEPKDVTLIAGQPLEIAVQATAPGTPAARVIFDRLPGASARNVPPLPPDAELSGVALPVAAGAAAGVSTFLYNERVDHMNVPARYRVEVAGTQSPWYTITLVQQVKLTALDLNITPPSYTRLSRQRLTLAPQEMEKPLSVVQGSQVEVAATVGVPVGGAILQAGSSSRVMTDSASHEHFEGAIRIFDDTPVSILITDGARQIISKLPETNWVIHCTRDAPPVIEMSWPTQDLAVAPDQPLNLRARLHDDFGLTSLRVLMADEGMTPRSPSTGAAREGAKAPPRTTGDAATDQGETTNALQPPLVVAHEEQFPPGTGATAPYSFNFTVPLNPPRRKPGNKVRAQLEITDGRALDVPPEAAEDDRHTDPRRDRASSGPTHLGPQTARSPVFTITFEEPAEIAREQIEKTDRLRTVLADLLKQQQSLHESGAALRLDSSEGFAAAASRLAGLYEGQSGLRSSFRSTAENFPFAPEDRVVQKTLLVLAAGPAREAADLALSLQSEPVASARLRTHAALGADQRRIIATLQSLLALLNVSPEPATQPLGARHEEMLSRAEKFARLAEALQKFMQQEQKVLDQTAGLAKKPVDRWDDNDRRSLDDLKMSQDNLDAFMQEKIADFSKNSEQDLSNSATVKDLMQILSEVTMAKDALKQKATEIAVAAEDNGLEGAKELSSNIEKWLGNTPDRQKFTQEDPLSKNDVPMPELPRELEDMIGKLLENEEDLFDEVEDANANWADSIDKGAGWDAADGPIADMSAKGVTGNVLPNNNEMNGRAGEGRQGKSQGEFVGDNAVGKGGRRTPTRLDPTPFAKGQIRDNSKDSVGGATGGGKISGQGGQGLEGPVPPRLKTQMDRLAQKQAELRNTAERLNLQYRLSRFDNFKLTESVALMRRVESDLRANRYANALAHRDQTLDDLDTSRLLLGGEVHVQQDTTPRSNQKLKAQIDDAMKGELPAAWSEPLKAYFEKLGDE